MIILVIGGVAAGTKAAAKLKRLLGDEAEIRLITKEKMISYAGCGLPYYIGDVVKDREELMQNSPWSFSKLTGVEVITGVEATGLDCVAKKVSAAVVETGESIEYSYDKLIIATGARPILPPVPGVDLPGVYVLRNPDDADKIKSAAPNMKRAVIVGGGLIGLETAENLSALGVRCSVVDMAAHILPGFDADFADYVENELADAGIPVFLGDSVTAVEGSDRVEKLRTAKRAIKTDAVIMSVGVKPNTEWLSGSGIELAPNGSIRVDNYMRTNIPDVYAAGDVVMVKNRVTGEDMWTPMGSSANLEGRQAAMSAAGRARHGFNGVLGTAVVKMPGVTVGKTGLGADAAKAAGLDYVSVTAGVDDKAHFYPGRKKITIRVVAERESRKLLGIQALGYDKVDKVIDIAVALISMGATLDDIDDMDFAYSPPYSSPIHPLTAAVNVLENKLDGSYKGGTQGELDKEMDWIELDVGKTPVIPTLRYVDVGSITGPIPGVPIDANVKLICTTGKNAYLAENRMMRYGYSKLYAVEGGTVFNKSLGGKTEE